MKSKYFCCVLLITLYLTVWFINVASASDSIKWYSYEEGKVLAKTEKKKVFLHFYADWCGFCLKMAKETFRDATVVTSLKNDFIAIRVDFDEESATAAKYGVKGLPSNWFLTEMGQPIVSIPGFIPPEALMSLLREVNEIKAGG
jgi:thioredoxin 1